MKRYGKFLIISLVVLVSLTVTTGVGVVAMGMKDSMSSMGTDSTTPAATAADVDSFKALWEKAYTAGAFTPEQTKRLVAELEFASQKLAENFKGLSDFLNQQKTAKGDAAKTVQKRIDLKEAERDLIASQVKVKLEEFLSKDQVNLILTVGFHGTSMNMTGEEHLNSIHGGMNTQMEMGTLDQLAMDLGELGEKINQNCEALTLELIRTSLAAKVALTAM